VARRPAADVVQEKSDRATRSVVRQRHGASGERPSRI
jgi:hypothetical protein